MKQRIISNWTILRLLRLMIGTGALIQGIVQREVVIFFAGVFLFITALLNFGCCGSAGCQVSYPLDSNRAKAGEKMEKSEMN